MLNALHNADIIPKVNGLPFRGGGSYRFKAEEYLLSGASYETQVINHYCTHHTHQDMNVCSTPRHWYVYVSM